MSGFERLRPEAAGFSSLYPSIDGRAFDIARAMLRSPGAMTIEQFRELDELLRAVTLEQFRALTDDPLHQQQLRRYESLAWRLFRPTSARAWLTIGTGVATIVTLALLLGGGRF